MATVRHPRPGVPAGACAQEAAGTIRRAHDLAVRGAASLEYGLAYTIEHWDGERWQKTDLAPQIFPQIAFILGPGEIGRPNAVEIPTDVESGFYRVTKDATEEGTGTALELHGLFQIR